MKKLLLFFALIGLFLTSASTNQAQVCAQGQMIVNGVCGDAALDSLQAGWNKIEPGGETMCAHGTPYSYWVRPGTRDDLLVYMEGGGGCWNAATCRDDGREFNGFYDSRITATDNPALRDGILDMENPENPFADYTTVYAPVCTGDVHWGDNVHSYDDEVTINFKGFVNTSAALDWAYKNVPNPDSVFVTGCSAGSAGSILHTPYIIEKYPETPVYQFGDSLSLIFTGAVDLQVDWHAHDNFAQWIPALAEMQPTDWTMAKMYAATANFYPDYTFSQYNSIRDSVQVFFTYPLGGSTGDDWAKLLDAHVSEIQQNAPNYRALTAGGELHCLTPRPEFYTYAIDGVRLRDWVADLASGKEVESLHCADCERAEFIR